MYDVCGVYLMHCVPCVCRVSDICRVSDVGVVPVVYFESDLCGVYCVCDVCGVLNLWCI